MGFPQIGLEAIFKDAGFNKALDAYKRSVNDADSLTQTAGKSMGDIFTGIVSGFGKIAMAAGALTFTAAIGAFTAIGKAAWEAGTVVDEAMDNIIIKTGATGQALTDLQDAFNRTLSNSASSAKDVGDAIGEVNRQFGYTGDDLAEFSLQVLDATRLMGGDVTNNVKDLAQAMKAFNISADEAVPTMEAVFVASQKSGVSFDELLQSVKTYASPMKTLKFSFKESVAMIAKWSQQGLNADKMIQSLRLGIANIVDPAKDADATLEDMGAVTGDIREKFNAAVIAIQSATTETEAMNLGMQIFGKRGGADLVTAIREGKLTADDFTAAMDDSSGAIERTFQATQDWPELMQVLKNRVTVALEPIGTKLLDIAKVVIEKFMPVFEEKVVPFISNTVVPIFDALGDALLLLVDGNFAGAIDALLPEEVISRWKDFSPILGGLAGIVKTALKGLTGANFWEDTPGFWDTSKGLPVWVSAQAGLKTQFITLGNLMLAWIVEGLADVEQFIIMIAQAFIDWANNPKTQADANMLGIKIGIDISQGIKGLFSKDETSDGISNTITGMLIRIGVNVGKSAVTLGWQIAMGISQGIWNGIFSPDSYFGKVGNDIFDVIRRGMNLVTSGPPTQAPTPGASYPPTYTSPPVPVNNPVTPAKSWHYDPVTGHMQWYAQGLINALFNRPTMIGVGEAGPELVNIMPMRGQETGRMSSPVGVMGGSTAIYNYNLTIHTNAPSEPIVADYRMLQSMGARP